jgi:hypothetical protein
MTYRIFLTIISISKRLSVALLRLLSHDILHPTVIRFRLFEGVPFERLTVRVSSKQTKIIFGSNRNKPKQDLFRVCFGLFREPKKKKIRFVSVFRTYIETTETNRSVS